MISILIPERGRPAMLARLIRSLNVCAGDDQNYEILIAVDTDDPAWPDAIPGYYDGGPHYQQYVWPRPVTLGVKLNLLAEKARGDVLCFVGNDMIMETPGWPAKIQAAADALPNGIGVPFLNSTLSPGEPTYPIITRKMVEAIGHFMDPAYPYWFIDTAWGEIGRMIGSLFPIDVTVSAPEGLGLTHAMIDLPFWVHYFEATRPERIEIARRILGHEVPADRVAECVRRTAHLSTPEFLERWGGTTESPPGPRYAEAKESARSHLIKLAWHKPGPSLPYLSSVAANSKITQDSRRLRNPSTMQPPAILVDANCSRYLDLLESVLTGTLTSDPAMDPWSDPTFDPVRRATGRDWPATALTMIGTNRMRQLRDACETVLRDGVPGDFIETGVWRGGACIYMRAILEAWGDADRKVWVADSFQGLPPPVYGQDRGDQHHTYKQLAISYFDVCANFERFGFIDDRVQFLKGWFKDTLPTAPIERLAVLRLDGDMYQSTIEALNALYAKLSPGGICIVDDYFMAPCRQAVTDYRAEHRIDAPIQFIDGMGVWWRK